MHRGLKNSWDFPGGPGVKTALEAQRVKSQSLVWEVRSHTSLGIAKNLKSQIEKFKKKLKSHFC